MSDLAVSNFIQIILDDNVEKAKLQIKKGIDVNCYEDSAKFTALHYVAQNNSLEMATLLILNGADILAKDESGLTPLDVAKLYQSNKVKHFLEELYYINEKNNVYQ